MAPSRRKAHKNPSGKHCGANSDSPAPVNERPPSPLLHKDDSYFMDTSPVIFQVEDRLFKVPRYQFLQGSKIFQIMLKKAASDNMGSNEDCPIKLSQDITHTDFGTLLKLTNAANILYCNRMDICPQPVYLMAIYVSGTLALSELQKSMSEMSPFSKIDLGRRHSHSPWVIEGYKELIRRADTLTDGEVTLLGYPATVCLLRIRERNSVSGFSRKPKLEVLDVIETDFQHELRIIREEEARHSSS
ncbi:hypothetical protein B0H34DRAFT_796252 [Crassisporium funariophilum]|nr:hypothetical protein B0H34DRAFT_796252 [Crassisporium funariophilum]